MRARHACPWPVCCGRGIQGHAELLLSPEMCSSFLGHFFVFLFSIKEPFPRCEAPKHLDKVHTISSIVRIAQTILPMASED